MSRITNIKELCKKHKLINDSIHGMFNISKLASLIIDHPYFQRLRYLKQLGACHYVYPNAVHTRFEHSLGTYYLTKKILNMIKINSSDYELNKPLITIPLLQPYFQENGNIYLDEYVIELISIAGLCHDLGHGPYSHMFDDMFIPKLQELYSDTKFGPNISHENRSTELLKMIINDNEKLKTNITSNEITFICDLINPNKDIHIGYIYQIVSNCVNSLDVDKFDYLTRDSKMLGINISFQSDRLINNAKVINNTIIYCKQLIPDIINLFNARHYMHRTIYGHKGVISIDYMLCELMLYLNKHVNFIEMFFDLTKFVEFTDYDIISQAKIHNNDPNIKSLLDNISRHQLFPLVYSKTIEKSNKYINLKDILRDEIIDEKINLNNYILHQSVIGYISGNKNNPLEHIFLYSTKDDIIVKLLDSNLTKLMPENFQETVIMVFYKEKTEDIKEIKKLFKS